MLDLGSGAGPDVIRAAEQVGPAGIVWGLDMTDEMLALARENAAEAGVDERHFLKGDIEEVPLPAESVDVAISNCVINLSTDKPAVFRELARVVAPGGRVAISDIVAEDRLDAGRASRARLLLRLHRRRALEAEYEAGLVAAGFEDVSVEFTPRPPRACTARSSRRRSRPSALAPDELVGEGTDRGSDRRRDEIDPE